MKNLLSLPVSRSITALGGLVAVLAFGGVGEAQAANTTEPKQPAVRTSADMKKVEIWRSGMRDSGTRILVSIDERRLWLRRGDRTLFTAQVAVGMNSGFSYNGRDYFFKTPRGQRRVLSKQPNPTWTPPDWHYYEKALALELEPVHLKPNEPVMLADSTFIEVRGDQVGRINRFGNFWPWTPGMEIIFDGKIFIPPLRSEQRKVPDALGPFKLDMGDGYLIHGTHEYNEDSIGQAVSHGCVRMANEDVTKLYGMVPVGTRVYIY